MVGGFKKNNNNKKKTKTKQQKINRSNSTNKQPIKPMKTNGQFTY